MNVQLPRKNPAETRQRLIDAAFSEIYASGFQGSDINGIIARAGVTKGALYHHFDSKADIANAVIDTLLDGITTEKWLAPLDDVDDPVDALIGIVEGTLLTEAAVNGGCPLNNLAQEMSGVNEEIRLRLRRVFQMWIGGVADALRLGQANGKVRRDIDARETATFMVATYEGYISLAKNARDPSLLAAGVKQVVKYLETLRPVPKA